MDAAVQKGHFDLMCNTVSECQHLEPLATYFPTFLPRQTLCNSTSNCQSQYPHINLGTSIHTRNPSISGSNVVKEDFCFSGQSGRKPPQPIAALLDEQRPLPTDEPALVAETSQIETSHDVLNIGLDSIAHSSVWA